MGDNTTKRAGGPAVAPHIAWGVSLVALALLCNYWFIGWLFSPSGAVDPFASKVFIGLFQCSLALFGVLVAVRGGTAMGRRHVLFSAVLFAAAITTVEAFTQVIGRVVQSLGGEAPAETPADDRLEKSPYQGKDWADALFAESRQAYRQRYRSFYLWSRQEFRGEHINVDGAGVRATWNPPADPEVPLRELFVFGGSTIWGTGARDGHTIPSYLSKLMHGAGHGYRVTNYGESAYTFIQEAVRLALLLKEGKRPDLVVFYDGVNDVAAAHRTGVAGVDMQYVEFQKRLLAREPEVPDHTLRQDLYLAASGILGGHCKTYQLISEIPRIYRAWTSGQAGSTLQAEAAPIFDLTEFPEVAANIDDTALAALAAGVVNAYVEAAGLVDHLSQAYGFEYHLFWQPVLFLEPQANEEEMADTRFADRSLGFLYEAVYSAIGERPIKNFHDISDVLHDREETVYVDFCHLSEAGNETVARRMAEAIGRGSGGGVAPGAGGAAATAADDGELAWAARPAVIHLTMEASNPLVFDASPGQYHQRFKDLSGNPNTDAHAVPGPTGTALFFDGVDDAIEIPAAQIGHVFAAGTRSDFSVAFWWRSDSDPFPVGYREAASNYSPINGGIILHQRGRGDGASNRIYMNFYVPGNSAPLLGPATRAGENVGVWHHYVFQREGQTLRAWCDGVVQGTYTGPEANQSMGSGNSFRLNSLQSGAAGALDDFRVYDRALTEAEIRELATPAEGFNGGAP